MSDNQSKRLSLGFIGVNKKEIKIIQSLVLLSPEIERDFELINNDSYDKAQVFFVNSENQSAMTEWQTLKSRRSDIEAIMVYETDSPSECQYCLQIPIVISRLLLVFKKALMATRSLQSEPKAKSSTVNFSILVVDDSLSVRNYMEQKLMELGEHYKVTIKVAESGETAVSMIKKQINAFDLVFLDVMMDDINGYQVCKWIKSVNKNMTVVMLTNRGSLIDKMRGSMSRCDAYLDKPPKDEELKSILQQAVIAIENR